MTELLLLLQAHALKRALLHRRDGMRSARADAEGLLLRATRARAAAAADGGGATAGATAELCAALAAGRAAALEGDATSDGVPAPELSELEGTSRE